MRETLWHVSSTNHYDVGNQPRLTAWQIVETLWISERGGYERFVCLQPPYSILRRTMEREHFPMSLEHGMEADPRTWRPVTVEFEGTSN